MKIEVTQRDISRGERGSITHCPVALAIKRATRRGACVSNECASVGDEDIFLPARVGKFIEAFDARKPVKPFTFIMRKPASATAP